MTKLNDYLDGPPAPGSVIAVMEGVYWVRLPLPFELNHINVWLIEDDNGWTLVDTGANASTTRDAWLGLMKSNLFDRPLTRIIVTHHHPDHMGLARWLSDRYRVPVFVTAPAIARARQLLSEGAGKDIQNQLLFFEMNGAPQPSLVADFVNGKWYRKLVSGVPDNVVEINPGHEIRIGGMSWQTIISYGHAEGHVSLYCAEHQAVISGDQVLPKITSNVSLFSQDPALDPLDDFLGSLADFRNLPPDTLVLPSHGSVFHGLHERVNAIENSHMERSSRIQDLLEDLATVSDMISRLFTRALDDVNWCLAFGEVHAHLRYLHNRGVIHRQEKNDIIVYYR